ncbi:DinB family protein [Lewinella sp. 4G2]|uniref:DinB family protein n=1 Tax=Lewinella sp. 4G2 TaxID=1803372 RepID=UPI0007B49012|nr:DinB family protein [Lewinella sp. 4G2]OAV45442.1 hypothetical protein A3850_013495 [Lewinella sp. 4G2]
MRVSELPAEEYNDYYAGYIDQIPDVSLRSALDESAAALLEYLTHVPENHVNYRYAPGKWTVKECLQHIIDTERVFAGRALRIGRGDTAPLPGFDQNEFASVAKVEDRRWLDMIEEFRVVRRSNTILFKSLTEEDLARIGHMSGNPASCRAIGFILCGHVFHHAKLYREKYGFGTSA